MTETVESLRRQVEDLTRLAELNSTLSSTTSVPQTLDMLAQWSTRLCHADRVSVLQTLGSIDGSAQTIAKGSAKDGEGIEHSLNTLIMGWLYTQKKPFIVEDLAKAFTFPVGMTVPLQYGPALALPILSDTVFIGAVNMVRFRGQDPFSEEECRVALQVADLATIFLKRARRNEDTTFQAAHAAAIVGLPGGPQWVPSLNPRMQETVERISRVAVTDATVLITGESGTGKELAAHAIHLQSRRSAGPFLAINCAALPATLAEAELFGHERGAFTGAERLRKGVFERAAGGTLFLDEISAMPLDLQAKLLRVLDDHSVLRIGGSVAIPCDTRIIAASNQDLLPMTRQGHFRPDLLHRLNVVPITLPPLRARREDIRPLALAILREFSGGEQEFTEDALHALESMEWPGNVRELRNAIQRLHVLFPGSHITSREVQALVQPLSETAEQSLRPTVELLLDAADGGDLLERVESMLVQLALNRCQGNIRQAARLLGIDRNAVHRRMKKLGPL
jgi:DNA-binding NtrC family response regulator